MGNTILLLHYLLIMLFVDRGLSSWLQLIVTSDKVTEAIQSALAAHQNRPDCASAKYFIALSHQGGMGSSLHAISGLLAHAISNGRILVYDNTIQWAQNPDFCGDLISYDCYFEPISNCSHYACNAVLNLTAHKRFRYDKFHDSKLKDEQFLVISHKGKHSALIPSMLKTVANESLPPPLSFWRSQSTKFIFKPNARTLAECAHFLSTSLVRLSPTDETPQPVDPSSQPPFQSISIYVRHGDKFRESRLHPFEEYLAAAEQLLATHAGRLSRHIILGTDNEYIINQLETNMTTRNNFTYYYTLFKRRNSGGPPLRYALNSGLHNFTFNSISNLIIATNPSVAGFVQTTISNWNRLINELRRADGRRASAPCIDLEYKEE